MVKRGVQSPPTRTKQIGTSGGSSLGLETIQKNLDSLDCVHHVLAQFISYSKNRKSESGKPFFWLKPWGNGENDPEREVASDQRAEE
jgi:hypothetical protein